MFVLGVPKSNFDIELPRGIKVTVRPPSTALMAAARHAGTDQVGRLTDEIASRIAVGASLFGLPDLSDAATKAGIAQQFHARGVGRQAIVAWTGVFEVDRTTPAPVTHAAIDELMDDAYVGESFLEKYFEGYDKLLAEGNALRPVPSGTSEAGRDTAASATPPATPAPPEDAEPQDSAAAT